MSHNKRSSNTGKSSRQSSAVPNPSIEVEINFLFVVFKNTYETNMLLNVGPCIIQSIVGTERSCCVESVGYIYEVERSNRFLPFADKSCAAK